MSLYLYTLERTWKMRTPRLGWVLLHPTTIAPSYDEALERCVGFARRWGFGAAEIVYLYAMRTTDTQLIGRMTETLGELAAVGPENDAQIAQTCGRCSTILAAWGATLAGGRDRAVTSILRERHPNVLCLGRTTVGQPKHPIDVPYTCAPEAF